MPDSPIKPDETSTKKLPLESLAEILPVKTPDIAAINSELSNVSSQKVLEKATQAAPDSELKSVFSIVDTLPAQIHTQAAINEQSAFSKVIIQNKIEAANTDHGISQKFKDYISDLTVAGIGLLCVLFSALIVFRVIDLLVPQDYKWLVEDSKNTIDTIILAVSTGAIGSFAGGYLTNNLKPVSTAADSATATNPQDKPKV